MKKLIVFVVLAFLMFGIVGCEESLRFAPSESIKQTAELTNQMARKINTEGTEAQSPASRKLVKGTQVALSYIGRPKEVPEPEHFETVSDQAQQDAEKRPDAWQMADSAIDLGIGVCALLGGVYGTRAVKFLKVARTKSKALQEIVKGNELFKETANEQTKQAFAIAQNKKQKTNGTKQIVAEMKLV